MAGNVIPLKAGTATVSNAEFLTAIMPELRDGEYGWVCSFEGDPGIEEPKWKWAGRPLDAWNMVPDRPGQNTYFSVAALRGVFEVQGKGSQRRRKKETFARLGVVVLDDGGPLPGLDPTWVLRTSIKDGKPNYQTGYRLDLPIEDVEVARRLHQALADSGRIAKDKNGNNPVRYVRLPIGSNGKYSPPHLHVLEQFEPNCMVSLMQFCTASGINYGWVLTGSAPAANAAPESDEWDTKTPEDWRRLVVKWAMEAAVRTRVDPERGRHEEICLLGGVLGREGVPRAYLDLALQTFLDTMRPTNTKGEVVAGNRDAEFTALVEMWERGQSEPRQSAGSPAVSGGGALSAKAAIEVENREFFVTLEGGKPVIAHETTDPEFGRPIVATMSQAEYKLLRANRFVELRQEDGSLVKKPVAALWLASPRRREFTRGMALLPNAETPAGVYNLWRGLAVEPVESQEKLKLPLWHIKNIICGGDHVTYRYLMRWMARAIQRPDLPTEVAVVMRGGRGTGKSTVGRWMVDLFGRNHGWHILQARHLTGNFNAHLRGCLMLFADEALFAGDRQGNEVLKGLITEPTVAIEKKGVDVYRVPNRLKIMMATNQEWAIPAGIDERRYLVLDVADTKKQDHTYFNALYRTMENGGLAALLHALLTANIATFNIRDVPQTAALTDQKLHSLPPILAWLHDRLFVGTLLDVSNGWEQVIPRRLIVEAFEAWCHRRGLRYTETSNKAVGDGLRKAFDVANGARTNRGGVRERQWRLPSLEVARRQFEERVLSGASVAWERDTDE